MVPRDQFDHWLPLDALSVHLKLLFIHGFISKLFNLEDDRIHL